MKSLLTLPRLKSLAWSLLRIYLLLVAALYFLQDYLLFHPSRCALDETRQRADAFHLKLWPSGHDAYRGAIAMARPSARGTVVVVHGNAGSALDRVYYAEALAPLGFNVLLYEYPGYGPRDGTLNAATLTADLRDTVQQLRATKPGPIYLWGESLGCGVAAQALADPSLPVAGAVLLAPWDSLAAVAQSRFPIVPVRWLLRDRYDSVAALAASRRPVVVVKMGRDEVIPPHHAQLLLDSLPDPKKLIVFPNAGHNSWPVDSDLPWWRETMEFLEKTNSPAR